MSNRICPYCSKISFRMKQGKLDCYSCGYEEAASIEERLAYLEREIHALKLTNGG